ncbi:MAG: di-heme oxidoredictase family protein, partial [Phycisphaerales bacterium]
KEALHEHADEPHAALLADCDDVPEVEDQPDDFGATFIDAVTDFQRYLAPPPQSPRSGMAGESLFNAVGCVKCHARQFTTADLPTLEPALRNRVIRPYSDFLLHDMGALADGIPDGDALGTEMRTPPLWNLRTRPVLLHNGSANQPQFAARVEAAIAAHAGEATASRNAYAALASADKAKVLAFLDSLGRDDYDTDGDGLLTGLDYGTVVTHAGDASVSPDEAWSVADLDQDGLLEADEINGLRSLLGIPSDCNQHGVTDWSEILSGATSDLNANGVPDECDQTSCTARVKRVSGTGGAIPDAGGGSLTRSIAVVAPAGNPAIQSVRVTLDISHTWLSDLTITLRRGSDPAVT